MHIRLLLLYHVVQFSYENDVVKWNENVMIIEIENKIYLNGTCMVKNYGKIIK
jgi:hypothetical protein